MAVAVALGLVGALAACGGSGTVDVDGPDVTGAQRTACERLVEALPEKVSDQVRRETSGSGVGAAWGDPAIVLRCGVDAPSAMGLVAQCQVADGLGWYVPREGMNDQSVDVVMTTIERRPRVEVVLPARYRPPSTAMIDLAKVVKAHTRKVSSCS